MTVQASAQQQALLVPPATGGVAKATQILPPAVPDPLHENVQDLTARILKLEVDAKAKADDGNGSRIAIIGGTAAFLGVIVAGLLTLLTAHLTANRERQRMSIAAVQQLELARQQAVFQQTEKLLEFRVKQLEEFYAPMFALLQQSTALYIKMCQQLSEDEPERYRSVAEPETNSFQMKVKARDGTWKEFRLVDQLPAVKKNIKAYALAKGIIAIAGKTTAIISEHAGLATADLMNILGHYLAHYAILSEINNGKETEPYEPLSHKVGYFPYDLSPKIGQGYRELSEFLDTYSKASKNMLEEGGKTKVVP